MPAPDLRAALEGLVAAVARPFCICRADGRPWHSPVCDEGQRMQRDAALAQAQVVLSLDGAAVLEGFDVKRFERAPCYRCDYSGPHYFQPDTHLCATLYHLEKEKQDRGAPGIPTVAPPGREGGATTDRATFKLGPGRRLPPREPFIPPAPEPERRVADLRADFRWLAGRLRRVGGDYYVVQPRGISQAEWDAHVAPHLTEPRDGTV